MPPVGVPFVTAGRDGSRRILCAVDAAARKAGLHVGMPVAEAQALPPGLALIEAEPERDREALDALAVQMLRRYSPIVALDAPDGLWIDTTGCDHLFGFEAAMLADLRRCLHGAGYACRVALAGTTGAAHALARFGRSAVTIHPAGRRGAAVSALPLAALRLSEDVGRRAPAAGFRHHRPARRGAARAAGRRFGMEVTRRLDQVSGAAAEPLDPIEPPDMPRVKLGFIEPIGTPEHPARAIADLADLLCVRLGEEGSERGGSISPLPASMAASRPSAPARRRRTASRGIWCALLIERLGTVDPGFGVETMTLSAPLAEPLDTRQIAAGFADAAGGDIALLVDTLANRLGAHRLYRAAPVESDIPERAVRTVAPLAPTLKAAWPAELPRPVRLLDPPEEVQTLAVLPDHPPRHFIWRGRRHHVTHADGPERVFGEWWRREAEIATVRDYFAVEDEAGARFWLFRSGDGSDPRDRLAPLVPARAVRHELRRAAGDHEFLLPAGGLASARIFRSRPRNSAFPPLAVTDRHSLAGMIRAHQAAKEHGVRLVVGCRLDLTDGVTVLVYPTDRAAYATALPAAHPGQGPRRQGRLRTRLGGPRRIRRGPAGHAGAGRGGRGACRMAGAAAGGFSGPLLYGADAAPPAQGCGAAQGAGRSRRAGGRARCRHQ